MSLPINRSAKATLDANLVNGITSDAPALKASDDVVYNTIDELYNYALSLVTSGTLSPIPPDFMQRQAIINGNFDVWQRGTIFSNPNNAYTADRFVASNSVDTNIKILQSTSVPNNKSKYSLRAEVMTATSGANAITDVIQKTEDYMFFAGEKVTFSGYVKCDAGASFQPLIDDGVSIILGTTITSATWVPFSMTATINNNPTKLNFSLRFARGGLAVGVGINLAQVQVNAGDKALPFQPRSFAEELQLCQRYYEKSYNHSDAPGTNNAPGLIYNVTADNTAGTSPQNYASFKVTKRTNPTVIVYGQGGTINTIGDGSGDKALGAGSFASQIGTSGFAQDYTLVSATSSIRRFHYVADAEI